MKKEIDVKNKVVLVTGGTGSLGSALVERLIDEGAEQVIVFSRDEFKQSEMMRRVCYDGFERIRYWLGDVRDLDRVQEVCTGVDIIFHVAALKRLDQSSCNTYEVADVNIKGTRNIVLAGKKCERIILVSTDKAYAATSVYGASKFIAERIVLAYRNGIVWRFGNFIDSRGSVFEVFKEQKRENKPLTITDLEATRFVIEMEQVCDYLLSENNPGLYYPQALKKMSIKEIADSIAPNHPSCILGLREGEKKHEAFSEDYTSKKI